MLLSKDGFSIFVGGRMPELELCKVGSNCVDPEFFDFLNFINFRHVNDISETFLIAGTKLGIFSFNLRY
jgi:hypothetical protein